MKTYVPSYYKDFSCIADKCRHSCCIGWEIDIDKKTLYEYSKIGGDFGKRLKENITLYETPHFILTDGERCPFLDECGLCDIYKELGEDALCDICTDHPRYRNFYPDREEMGLGLCCEEAARLILSQKEPFTLEVLEDDGEVVIDNDTFINERQKIFAILSDKTKPFSERIKDLGVMLPQKSFNEWLDIYLSLEILDPEWKKLLLSLKGKKPENLIDEYQNELENLLTYFVFRHLKDGEFSQRLAFCTHLALMIADIFSFSQGTFEELCDIARMASSEIEYSEDNTDELIFFMSI